MRKKKVFLVLQAGACIVLAMLLAAGAVGIYTEGAARKAENPLESIYTVENVAERFGRITPATVVFFGLLIAGRILGIGDPNADQPAKTGGPVKTRQEPKHKNIIQAVLIMAAIVLIILGILNGSAVDVLVKAINICTECVGLG